jgi:hypothetical protein
MRAACPLFDLSCSFPREEATIRSPLLSPQQPKSSCAAVYRLSFQQEVVVGLDCSDMSELSHWPTCRPVGKRGHVPRRPKKSRMNTV